MIDALNVPIDRADSSTPAIDADSISGPTPPLLPPLHRHGRDGVSAACANSDSPDMRGRSPDRPGIRTDTRPALVEVLVEEPIHKLQRAVRRRATNLKTGTVGNLPWTTRKSLPRNPQPLHSAVVVLLTVDAFELVTTGKARNSTLPSIHELARLLRQRAYIEAVTPLPPGLRGQGSTG